MPTIPQGFATGRPTGFPCHKIKIEGEKEEKGGTGESSFNWISYLIAYQLLRHVIPSCITKCNVRRLNRNREE